MNIQNTTKENNTSRRNFIKKTGVTFAGLTVASSLAPGLYAAENNTINIALVGCGGRGTGAVVNALKTQGPTRLYAMADVFENRLKSSLKNISNAYLKQVAVSKDRQFVGFDGYKKAIDAVAPGGVVILATPPAFRPMHLEYAVSKNCNVFMEKSFAVDAPGIQRVIRAGKEAEKKNLKIAGGLMSRHSPSLQEGIGKIHDGIIGDLVTCWAYREHHPVGHRAKTPDVTEMGHQIRNYNCYTWMNGSFILDWLIHNIDICCWCKDAWPVSAQGQGGREVRTAPDQLFDHYAVEYHFPDGTRMFAQGRHMAGCWGFWGDVIHGTKGSAILGEGINNPKIYKGHNPTNENVIWRYKGPRVSPYDVEHQVLFDAIRNDKKHNETDRCAKAAMAGILGRMAAESGDMITWEKAMASQIQLAPGIEDFTMDSDPPVKPDANGNYPVAVPGVSKVV